MDVHLIDGTYELFRHHYGVPSTRDATGREVGAVIGVVSSLMGMLRDGGTHLGVATDHVVESFRNALWPGYKTSEGIEPDLLSQFPLLEEAIDALGVAVWPMIELEADDALASAAVAAANDARVERVYLCTPDKDLAQSVVGTRIVQLDRRQRALRDEAGVVARFGVGPSSIPDYLGLVGDSADGFPGLEGWGPKSASTVLAAYGHLEEIPADWRSWTVSVRNARGLSDTLQAQWENALLFRRLATLRTDAILFSGVDDLRWKGPSTAFASMAAKLGAPELADRADFLARSRER